MNSREQTQVVLITGGGSGIGRATAVLFAEHGWQVMVGGRRESPLIEVADLHANISYHVSDVSDVDQARGLVAHTIDASGVGGRCRDNGGSRWVPGYLLRTLWPGKVRLLFGANGCSAETGGFSSRVRATGTAGTTGTARSTGSIGSDELRPAISNFQPGGYGRSNDHSHRFNDADLQELR